MNFHLYLYREAGTRLACVRKKFFVSISLSHIDEVFTLVIIITRVASDHKFSLKKCRKTDAVAQSPKKSMYHKYVKFTLEIRHNSIDGESVGFWGYSEAYATFRKYQICSSN